MSRETKPTWEDIDRRVETLYDLDEAARQDGWEQLWIDIFELLSPRQMDILGKFWLEDFSKFDPKKGRFSQFLRTRLELRREDEQHGENGDRRVKGEDGERRWKANSTIPWDAPTENDKDGLAIGERFQDPTADPADMLFRDADACQLILAMLNLTSNLTGQANNPRRRNYFRLFFTDGVSHALRTEKEPLPPFLEHERDLFSVLKEAFLDFFLTEQCRTVATLAASRTRPYGEVVEGKSVEPLEQPLPDDVFTTYLSRVEGEKAGASALSQQRKAYRDYLRKALC